MDGCSCWFAKVVCVLFIASGHSSVVGLIATMTDHYNVMEGGERFAESIDAIDILGNPRDVTLEMMLKRHTGNDAQKTCCSFF